MEFDNESEVSDSEEDGSSEVQTISISKEIADENYEIAGTIIGEEIDQISLTKHQHLLSDKVHLALQEVLEEVRLPFELADFQKVSLHVLGSCENLILISPTGSGKMMIVYLGSLLMRKILKNTKGVTIGTQPLSLIMEEKLKSSLVPTCVISMAGDMKHNLEPEENKEVVFSSTEEDILSGKVPVIIGHHESMVSDQGQQLVRKLHREGRILMEFAFKPMSLKCIV